MPRAPRDDAGARSMKYIIMMSIRVVCFILMVVVTPYGWYTWVFGAGAVILPYIAVVIANVSSRPPVASAENPELTLTAAPPPAPPTADSSSAHVIRIEETLQAPVRRAADAVPPEHPETPASAAPETPDDRREDGAA
nr:DUF3099 domain-containing protein [Microbacterium immunditiarum]